MKTFTKSMLALALLAGILMTGFQVTHAAGVIEKPALIFSNKDTCVATGGTWEGVNLSQGTCTYPPGSLGHTGIGACTASQNLIITFPGITWSPAGESGLRFSRSVPKPNQGISSFISCEDIPSSGPGYGKCGGEAGKTDEAVTINTCHGTSVSFAAGACTGKCTVGPKVLNTAKKGLSQLDGEVLGEAYVKVRNPDGGSYKICFPGEGTIYKWVSGAWVAQATQTVGGVSCAWSSGDGNYVLVAP